MAEVSASTSQYTLKVAGQDFQVLELKTSEAISTLFELRLTVFAEDVSLDVTSFIRESAEVKVKWGDKERSCWGIVSRFALVAGGQPPSVEKEYGEYEVQIVPRAWALTERFNCRIFQDKKVDEILKKVFDDAGLSGAYELKLKATYPAREYCVQYRESDLDFASRLMEEEGIFYFFTFDGADKLVLADENSSFATCAPDDKVQYKPRTDLLTGDEVVLDLGYGAEAYGGKIKLKDFNYRNVDKPLKVEEAGDKHTDLEDYDYHPELYLDDGRGKSLAKVRLESTAACNLLLTASGPWRSASAGHSFTLERSFRTDLNKEWVVLSARQEASQQGDSGVSYEVHLEAFPKDLVFRSEQVTGRPVMGPQTAKVVGPEGEKIYMDDDGRAKVQFHWDLEGEYDEQSSCWIRVAQPYAGIDPDTQKKHGFHWHPLIGDEVVVSFLEGDPDKPLVTGSVYNSVATPLAKPADLVRNQLLTPYQHRLDLDDKNTKITLNTGGNEKLVMVDKERNKGKVTLTTVGEQQLELEDESSEYGNVMTLKTSDDHSVQFFEKGDNRGIVARTKEGNTIRLDDKERCITFTTTDQHSVSFSDKNRSMSLTSRGGHRVLLDDQNKAVKITTSSGHRLELSDQNDFLEMADSGGQHSIKIDAAGAKILVKTSGDIVMKADGDLELAAGGSIKVDASKKLSLGAGVDLEAEARKDLTLRAKNIENKATNKHQVKGRRVEHSATVDLKLKAMTLTSEAQIKNTLKGTLVQIKANGLATIRGLLVKIN